MSKRSTATLPKHNGVERPPMTQPYAKHNKAYVYGVDPLDGDDAWAMFEAAADGDTAKAEALLTKDRRLVNAQYWYQFPLHLAVYAGHAEMVDLLLARGADPGQSIYTYNSWNKLLASAAERNEGRIEESLRRAMRERFNYSPAFDQLKSAIVGRDRRAIERLLKKRSDLAQSSDSLGNTALHWSVLTRQFELLKVFVEAGTPIDARRADGQTAALLAACGATDYWFRETRGRSHPSLRNNWLLAGALLALGAEYTISIAAAAGDWERIEELLKRDASLATRLDAARISPLSYAAGEGHAHIVQKLLDLGANPNLPEDGATRGRALFEACARNDLPIAKLLLDRGADPNAGTDSNGCCLTICEVFHGDRAKPLQTLLRKHGAYTPLYVMTGAELEKAISARRSPIPREELFEFLMEHVDRDLLERFLNSPFAEKIVRQWNGAYPRSPAILKKMLAMGLDVNRPNWLGKTFLHLAAENGDDKSAAIFLKAGADVNACDVEFLGTPLAAAVRSCSPGDDPKLAARRRRTIDLLLRAGSNVNLPHDKPWATPLAWARKAGLAEIEASLDAVSAPSHA